MDHQLSYLGQALDSEQFADVTLCCQSRKLRAHRILLSASSPYLQKLLLNHSALDPITIILDGVHHEDMAAILVFIYTGKVSVDKERFHSFLTAASLLDIEILNPIKGKDSKLTTLKGRDFNTSQPPVAERSNNKTNSWSYQEISQMKDITEEDEYKYKLMKLEQEATNYLKSCANLPKEYLMKSIEKARAFVEEKMSKFEEEAKSKFEDLERKHNEYRKSRKCENESVISTVEEDGDCELNVTEILNNLPGMSISKVHLDELAAKKLQKLKTPASSCATVDKPRGLARVKPLPLLMPIASGQNPHKQPHNGHSQRVGLIVKPNNGHLRDDLNERRDDPDRIRGDNGMPPQKLPRLTEQFRGPFNIGEHQTINNQRNMRSFESFSEEIRPMKRQLFTNGSMDLSTHKESEHEHDDSKSVRRSLDMRETQAHDYERLNHGERLCDDAVNDLSIRKQTYHNYHMDSRPVNGSRRGSYQRPSTDDDDIQILEPVGQNHTNKSLTIASPIERIKNLTENRIQTEEEDMRCRNNDIYERILRYREEIRNNVSRFNYVNDLRANSSRLGTGIEISEINRERAGSNVANGANLISVNNVFRSTKGFMSTHVNSTQLIDYGNKNKHNVHKQQVMTNAKSRYQGRLDDGTVDYNLNIGQDSNIVLTRQDSLNTKASADRVFVNESRASETASPVLNKSVQSVERRSPSEVSNGFQTKSSSTSPILSKSLQMHEDGNASQNMQPSIERINILNRILEETKKINTNQQVLTILQGSYPGDANLPKRNVQSPENLQNLQSQENVHNSSILINQLQQSDSRKSNFRQIIQNNLIKPQQIVKLKMAQDIFTSTSNPITKHETKINEPQSSNKHHLEDVTLKSQPLPRSDSSSPSNEDPPIIIKHSDEFPETSPSPDHTSNDDLPPPSLLNQALQADKTVKTHCCADCGKAFTRRQLLVQHQRIHNGVKPYKCVECGKEFTQKGHWSTHLKQQDPGSPGIPCGKCSKTFITRAALKLHQRCHAGVKPYQCPAQECGKEFSQLRNFKYHLSIHAGTKEFSTTCPECGKYFNDRGYLSSHMKIHLNRKEYQCQFCDKRFNQRVAYNMHVRIHTGIKPHECTHCTKSFSRKMLLKQHLRIHTGERPFSCNICNKAFADRSNMSLHMRLHSGIKPYTCAVCEKSFTKKHHLKTHMNYHMGVKPYTCSKCDLTFSQSSNMRTHFKRCLVPAKDLAAETT